MKIATIESVAFLALQTLSVCLGTMAIGGLLYAFYRIIADNLV
jgi:hypothetical protein